MENDDFHKAMLGLLGEILVELRGLSAGENSPIAKSSPTSDKLMTREKVQRYLNISESTYKRMIKEGELKPMIVSGGHRYMERDLKDALKESIRKGRI